METKASVVLAILVVLILIIVAVFMYKKYRGHRDQFMPGDPATPKLREAASLIQGNLQCILQTRDHIRSCAVRADLTGEDQRLLSAAKHGAELISENISPLYEKISHMVPTYENVLAIYQGLCDSDQSIWTNADAFNDASKQLTASISHQKSYENQISLSVCARQLQNIAKCCYSLCRSINYLGASLGLV